MSESLAERQAHALQRLRERFQATIGNTIDALRQLGDRLGETPDAPMVVDALRRELHRIHGTAGSYGFTEASRIAGQLEERAVRWSRDPALDRAERPAIVQQFVIALDAAFRQPAGSGGDDSADARAKIVVVGADETAHRALHAEAARRGFQLALLTHEQAQVALLRQLAPVLIAAPVGLAPSIAETAWILGVPLVAMEGRPTEERRHLTAEHHAPYTTVDVTASYAPVFDIAERTAARAGLGGVTVLALDDDPAILAMVQYVLERPGLSVHAISSADELMPALDRLLPSLLLSDINMPGLSGIEIARRLRADPRYRDLPIVLLSSETEAASRDEALRAGADEFVSKPIAPAELRHRIADRLDRHRLQRLTAGLHPATGLPMGARAAREAGQGFARLAADGAVCTVAVVRPIDAGAGAETTAWLREALRIAGALKPSAQFIGHHDANVLDLVLGLDAASAAAHLTAVARAAPSDAPRWHAGLVDAADVVRADFATVLRSAEEALDVAQTLGQEVVRQWQRDEATVSPDVIVVEDDPALSDMLQYALRATGFTYRAFSNGRVALDYLLTARTQGRRPIVLLDVDLPGMDGYSIHERISVERAGDFAVVFVTVHGAESDQLRALKGGAIDFVIKPLNLRILMAKMSSWAASARHPGTRP